MKVVKGSIVVGLVAMASVAIGGSAVAGQSKVVKKVFSSGNLSTTIVGDGATTPLPTIRVGKGKRIKDIDVRLRAVDDRIGDLDITLLPPSGPDITVFSPTVVNIAENIGSGSADCSGTKAVLNDEASASIANESSDAVGAYKPNESLSKLDGRSPKGNWRLLIGKNADNDGGALFCWQLKIKYVK